MDYPRVTDPSPQTPDISAKLANATAACRESLVQCLSIRCLKQEWAEDRLADFELWDASVGASSNSQSSLGQRLESKPHIRSTVLSLLFVLKTTIDRCASFGRLVDQEDSSAQMSKNGIDHLEMPGIADEQGSSTQAKLLRAVQAANALLSDLVQISLVIRSASVNSHNARADASFHIDDPKLEALKEHLKNVILTRPTQLEKARDAFWKNERADFSNLSIKEQETHLRSLDSHLFGLSAASGQMTSVQERLLTANLRRNHRFRYSRRHALKMAKYHVGSAAATSPQTGNGRTLSGGQAVDTLPDPPMQPSRNTNSNAGSLLDAEAVHVTPLNELGISDTAASSIDSAMIKQTARLTATAQQSAPSSTVASKIKSSYPRPPSVRGTAQGFRCPCCCLLLSQEHRKDHQWRKHICADLLPYTCVLRGCITPGTLYKTKAEWIKHMIDHHNHSTHYYECSLCAKPVLYRSRADLEAHVRATHSAKAVSNISVYVDTCSKPRLLADQGCPLCSFGGETVDISGEELLAHVAEHVHSLSLNSFPLESDDDENGKKGRYFQAYQYFAESNGNASAASRGTLPKGQQLRNAADESSSSEELVSQPSPTSAHSESGRREPYCKILKNLPIDDGQHTKDRDAWLMALNSQPAETDTDTDQSRLSEKVSFGSSESAITDPSYLRTRIQKLLETHVIGLNPEGRYLPDEELESLLQPDSIKSALAYDIDNALLHFILDLAPKTFATLQLVFREPQDRLIAIQAFLDTGFTDAMLESDGLTVCGPRQCMSRCMHHFPSSLWDGTLLQHFETIRWQFLVPTFNHEVFQYEFDNQRILPFRAAGDSQTISSGNFSDVSCVTMLAGKQTKVVSREQEIVVAHKMLKPLHVPAYDIEHEWRREVEAHKKLNGISSHMVQAIAAYRIVAKDPKNNTYHLILEWADGGDLHSFWRKNPQPQLDGDTERSRKRLKSMLRQLLGLAEALDCMHSGARVHSRDFMKQSPLVTPVGDSAPPVPEITVQDTESDPNDLHAAPPLLSRRRAAFSENWRHGDIKPENILRFTKTNDESQDWIGMLKLTDLGRAQQHLLKTQLRETVERERWRTRWYEPPDLSEDLYQQAHGKISRLFDIWSMGCVIFETVIWLLYGYDAIERLHNMDSDVNDQLNGTPYWTKTGYGRYKVTDMVSSWMEHILDHSAKDTSAIGDLVNLVKDKLLQINLPSDSERYTMNYRTNASDMSKELSRIIQRADESEEYLWDAIRGSTTIPRPAQKRVLKKKLPSYFRSSLLPDTSGKRLDLVPSLQATMITQSREYSDSLTDNWPYVDDHNFAKQLLAADQIPHDDTLCEACKSLDIMSPFLVFSKSMLLSKCDQCGLCDLVLKALDRVQTTLPTGDEIQLIRDIDCFVARGSEGTWVKILRLCHTDDEPRNATGNIPMGAPSLYDPPGTPKAADAFMRLPKAWLQDCDRNHKRTCATIPGRPQLPKILVDLRSKRPKIVDSENIQSSKEDVRYIAFSHCWGDMPPNALTTRSNLPARRSGIPLREIPPSFADAIAITKALECEYLWIDSLCMVQRIQAGDDDFAEQANTIPAIFSNAYCVVAAASATGANEGFLRRDIEEYPLDAVKLGEVYVSAVTNDFDRDVVQGRLHKRGWTLQERALARRTLYFTTNQMYWECGDGVRCETLQKLRDGKTSFLGDAHFPSRTVGVSRSQQIHLWTTIFKYYTTLEFSHAGDRAFALNGLIDRLASALKTRSLFGLFGSFWGRCLLWQRPSRGAPLKKFKSGPHFTEPPPSWSWMSVDGAIDFLELQGGEVTWNPSVAIPWENQPPSSLIHGPAQHFWRTMVDLNFEQECIIYDDGENRDDAHIKCVIIGTREVHASPSHYVLLVSPAVVPEGPARYERVGVGLLLDESIDREHSTRVAIG